MEKSNEEVTKKENKVKKFLKKNWPYLVGAGVVVGGTALGIKVHKNHVKHIEDGQKIIDAFATTSQETVNYGKDCLKELMSGKKELLYTEVDEDIYTKMAAAIETAVLNYDRDLPNVITLERGYDLGDDWHKNVTIKIEDWFS